MDLKGLELRDLKYWYQVQNTSLKEFPNYTSKLHLMGFEKEDKNEKV